MSNLNQSVSESDLVDLFCAIGAIRDAKLSPEPGSAVITFVKRAAAMAAITKYNGRELDKQKIMGKCSIHAKLGYSTTVGTPNKATKNFREIGSNKARF